jgi:hypothetical protein
MVLNRTNITWLCIAVLLLAAVLWPQQKPNQTDLARRVELLEFHLGMQSNILQVQTELLDLHLHWLTNQVLPRR